MVISLPHGNEKALFVCYIEDNSTYIHYRLRRMSIKLGELCTDIASSPVPIAQGGKSRAWYTLSAHECAK